MVNINSMLPERAKFRVTNLVGAIIIIVTYWVVNMSWAPSTLSGLFDFILP